MSAVLFVRVFVRDSRPPSGSPGPLAPGEGWGGNCCAGLYTASAAVPGLTLLLDSKAG